MFSVRKATGAASLAAVTFLVLPAGATPCAQPLDAAGVVRCAFDNSLDLKLARQELDVLAGRRKSAGVLLPSNPVVGVSAAWRLIPSREGGGTAVNWYVTLSQEIEIAGQRGARLDVVDAETAAQVRRVGVVQQEVAAQALSVYFELLALQDIVTLSTQVARTADALGVYAAEREKEKLMAPVDADLLRAEGIRVALLRFDAERRIAAARTLLAVLLGLDPGSPVELTGSLEVPSAVGGPVGPLIERALLLRGEVAAAETERKMIEAQLRLWRRSRIPNPTLSFIAQNDGANELVFGGGISLPIPLPGPLGHTYAGEIAETRARLQQSETTIEQVQRRVRQEVAQAWSNLQGRTGATKLFSEELQIRARGDLEALREGLAARQLSVREALLAQRTLFELLLTQIDARLALALAWVDLMRVTGQPFPGVNR